MKSARMIRFSLVSVLLVAVITASSCIRLVGPSAPEVVPEITPTATVPPSPLSPTFSPPQPPATATDLPGIAAVVAKVKPSVVAINVRSQGQDFFGNPVSQQGAGSGWIIDSNGLVVTNNHVVEGATSISVTLADGRTFSADPKQVHTDPIADLAVVKIDAADLPALAIGDSSKLNLGDGVVAIGNSLGRGIRVTNGIVSELGVSLEMEPGVTLEDLVGTNAAINPGNSGGPLVTMAGQVIGITSAKISAVGVEGEAFAISIKAAMPIIQQLITKGFVTRAFFGVSVETISPFAVFQRNLPVSAGALVDNVGIGSPAEKAGIKAGDIIVKFNGKDVATSGDLLNGIHAVQVGQSVEVVYWRGKAQNTTTAVLVESPAPGS